MKNIKRLLVLLPIFTGAMVLSSCGGNNADVSDVPVVDSKNAVYVSVNGNNEADGTEANPLDFVTAYNKAKPGQFLLLDEGTYSYSYRLQVDNSGEAGKYITVMPKKENTRVVFDFSKMIFNSSNRGIQIYGNYWHFYNIEVTGAGDNGMYIAGNHNIIERCQFYNNRDTGLQLGRGYSEYTTVDQWPSYNLIKNCTSFANYDAETLGENADGFAAKLTIGHGNVFDGCIAFRNSDDGWDMFAKVDSGNIGTVALYNCVSFENGFLPYQIDAIKDDGSTYKTYDTPNGDGIGFKLGGSVMEGDVIIENCVAFNNKLHGFGDNSNPGFLELKNCTAFNNCIGLTEDGNVSDVRGYGMIANKSNNFDLARSTASYNSYYGLLSYINNQKNYSTANDNAYNEDMFRGSVGYSIFNTKYDKGEKYVAFTGYEDASSYHSSTVDVPYSGGTDFTGLTDQSFADLTPYNAKAQSVADLSSLCSYHTSLRNKDGSVNLNNKLKVVDENLLKFANGKAIGANLSKSKDSEYPHFGLYTFKDLETSNFSEEKVDVLTVYSVLSPITNINATYQDFDVPKLMSGCSISWKSDKPELISVESFESSSISTAVFSIARVVVPEETTTVKLTARISKGAYSLDKTFDIVLMGRNQELGALASTGNKAIRVEKYGSFVAPRIYALDSSSTNNTELPLKAYTMTQTIEFATSGDSEFYPVDGVYTSVAGVYKVTSVAKSNRNPEITSTFVYNVYVVDPDCDINYIGAKSITLTRDGVKIAGNLTNIDGYVAAIVSPTARTLTINDFLTSEETQYYKISDNYVAAEFVANNLDVTSTGTQYYVYYVVFNANKSNTNKIESFVVNNQEITSEEEFYNLARGLEQSDELTIYSLSKDLDFTDFYWYVTPKDKSKAFTGLFNGNGHTIKNISITANNTLIKNEDGTFTGEATTDSNNEKYFNVFYKLQNGTIMNVNFDNIVINNLNAKLTGIVGDMQGGYIHKVKLTNIGMISKESSGAMVGQITGGVNYISEVSLVNPLPDKNVTDHSTSVANDYIPQTYKISTTNKYAGGIVGNIQMNSDQTTVRTYISNCYVNANIGDGNDAQGNAGGIIGRIKNDNVNYYTFVEYSFFMGTVISKGQYQGGIIGDLDNGSGATVLENCVADARFVWNSLVLDSTVALLNGNEQQYAHKNSNPMIGRATLSELGSYTVTNCVGSWVEYYATSSGIVTSSMAFNLSSEDDEGNVYPFKYSDFFWKDRMGFDLNIWEIDSTTHIAKLK